MQARDSVSLHVPVVSPFPPEARAELRPYRFRARERRTADRDGTTLIAHFNDPDQQLPFQRASAQVHIAAVEYLRGAAELDAAETVVLVSNDGDAPGVVGDSSMLAAACGDVAARWLRPGAAGRLPALVATGELRPSPAGGDSAAGTLAVLAVNGVARKLAAVRAALADPASGLGDGPVVVALPEANLHGDGGDNRAAEAATIREAVAALRGFGPEGARRVAVVEARTLADVLTAWCPADAWCSAEAAAQFAGSGQGAATVAGPLPAMASPSYTTIPHPKPALRPWPVLAGFRVDKGKVHGVVTACSATVAHWAVRTLAWPATGPVPARRSLIGVASLLVAAAAVVAVAAWSSRNGLDCGARTTGAFSPAACSFRDVTVNIDTPQGLRR